MARLLHQHPAGEHSFVSRYDEMIFRPEMQSLYQGSGFYNVGDWSGEPSSLPDACAALVRRHIEEPPTASSATGMEGVILDVGCGLGAGTSLIAERFPKASVTGINFSSRQLAYAAEHYPKARYAVMDATRLALPDASVDWIISIEAAFHFETRADFLKEAARVLKPGGQITLTDILFKNAEWTGAWSVPGANDLGGIDTYRDECLATGLRPRSISDIKRETWLGFCDHLRGMPRMGELSRGLERAVHHYLYVELEKPLGGPASLALCSFPS